ncbi:hypothetical protein AVEN_25432-1 [Araneus ventricosus]|uniref:Uncharacterized protein n=1 Tax=Araneus ventricosus TaxID=182803 RepID=A0A4Y2NEE2_ARAVE|nr:hypothetical protein AVEN_172614-1 [Araneus ventricosus]GBN37827.1 hypothetical protein AVEN_25432-1 [Araneus ventricosus]
MIPSSPKTIYLKILVVWLKNGGQSQYAHALFDDGSQRSYIEKDLAARELRLLPSGKETLSQGLFGENQTPEAEHYRYTINVEIINGNFSCEVSLLDQPKICTLPRVHDKHLLAELENHGIVLTDIGEETPPIRLLLGADVVGRILSKRIELLKSEFYGHCRVIFGVTLSPFLLNANIRHHLNSTEYQLESLQTTVKKLKRGFYEDNLITSVESQEELEQFKTQTLEIMNAASFELRCWAHTGVQDQKSQSVLGIKWDTETDELYCISPQVDIGFSEIASKRNYFSLLTVYMIL